jgi:hypothetical protein
MHLSQSIGRMSMISFMYATALTVSAVPVKITLGYSTPYMNLTEQSTGEKVDVGNNYMNYSLDLKTGDYTLELLGSDADKTPNGTIRISIPEESDGYTDANPYQVSVALASIRMGTKNDDGTYFQLNDDYVVSDFDVSPQQGSPRTVTYAAATSWGVPAVVFPVIVGDTYRITLSPNEKHPTYTPVTCQGTVSSTFGATETATFGYYIDYTITAPKAATLFVGKKIKHFMPFEEITPVSTADSEDGTSTVYTYSIPSANSTCYYRLSMPGVMTHAGKFGAQKDKNAIVFTEAELREHGAPDYFNHDVTENQKANFADILLNINKRGHLRMKMSDTKAIVANRVWQLTDDDVNNYFVEPDYHFTVLDENFQPSGDVISIDKDGNITPQSNGTAIVMVTYDACYAHGYNKIDGSYFSGRDYDYWFGAKWSALWAENTGLFVVSVGDGKEADSETFVPNFVLDKEVGREDLTIDSEHDVLYYFEDEAGYNYTYAPTGAVKVEVANPVVDSEKNTVSYEDGFKTITANQDGTYSILLTFGRNIIRTTAADGSVAYQVLSAKPCGYEIINETNPGSDVYPGNQVSVQFHGFYHPMSKLAGIYNQSAAVNFDVTNNTGELIQTSAQYNFCGSSEAQKVSVDVSYDYRKDTLAMTTGSIHVYGYGSRGGMHRDIDRSVGVNPDFNAEITSEYWGSIPNVYIPIHQPTGGVVLNVTPESAHVSVTNSAGHAFVVNEEGQYILNPGKYTCTVEAEGYFSTTEEFEVASEVETKQITLSAPQADQTKWDGVSVVMPQRVSAQESTTEEFRDMEGYYKIGSSYELAWIQQYVAKTLGTTNLVLTADIDLDNHLWSPIGSGTLPYTGAFEGNNHSILNLNMSGDGVLGFGFIGTAGSGTTVRNLSVYGNVSNTGEYTAGIVGIAGLGVYENLENHANVSSSYNYVAGVLGRLSGSEDNRYVARNLRNYGRIIGTNGIGGVIAALYSYVTYNLSGLVNTGDITVESADYVNTPAVGGIVGVVAFGPGLNLSDSYNTGNIYSSEPLGETGAFLGDLVYCDYTNNLTRVYNTGKVPDNRLLGAIDGSEIVSQKVYAVSADDGCSDFDSYAEFLPSDAFENGYVAWLLGDTFGQTLGTDASPVLGGDKVCRVTYTSNINEETEDSLFTNGVLPLLTAEGYNTGVWYTAKEGDITSSVSADARLYVLFPVKTGIGENLAVGASMVYNGSVLTVTNMNGSTLTVYAADGTTVCRQRVSGNEFAIDLPLAHGTYIARCGTLVYKFKK